MLLRDPDAFRRLSRGRTALSGLVFQLVDEIEKAPISSAELEDLAMVFTDLASLSLDQANKIVHRELPSAS